MTGVITDKGRIAADQVVVALGSFTAPLLAKLGIRVPIYPVKGISITFPRGAWNSAPRMPVIDDSKLFGLVPIGDRMRISGSAEITGYDTTPATRARRRSSPMPSFTFPELTRHLDLRQGADLGGAAAGQPGRHADHRADRDRAASGSMPATAISAGRSPAARAGSLADLISGRNPGIKVPAAARRRFYATAA